MKVLEFTNAGANRKCRMIRLFGAFPALLVAALFLLPAGEVLAQAPDVPPSGTAEKEADSAVRVVPDPMTPSQNMPTPKGVVPAGWTSWTSGQVIVRSDRISITMALGGLLGTAGDGAEMFDDNSYSTILRPHTMGFAELGFTLMPSLNLFVGASFQFFYFGHPRRTDGGNLYRYKTSNLTSRQFYLGTRFKLPFSLWGPRLFSISKAESGTGFVPYAKLALGLSKLPGINMYDPSLMGEHYPFYKETQGFYFGLGLGMEGRWRVFSLFIEFSLHRIGQPELVGPYAMQDAGDFLTYSLVAGMAFYI
jgi:hypothetical protein